MATNNYLNDLAEGNENVRQPICFCLDVSGSMSSAIAELNQNIAEFYKQLLSDENTRYSADVAIVTFGQSVSVYEDFSGIDKKNPPQLSADGGTPMGEGVQLAVKILGERKKEYKAHGIDYLQPWLVIMSDGAPGDLPLVKTMQADCMKLIKSEKLLVISIGIGSADMNILQGFSDIPVFNGSQQNDFKKFFRALAKSVVAMAASPNEKTASEVIQSSLKEDDGWDD
jgi:uncharacterized protein YegL